MSASPDQLGFAIETADNGAAMMVTVIDDDRAVAESLCAVIRSMGVITQACTSPRQLLLDDYPTKPGCIVLDLGLRMDGMNGLDLLNRLTLDDRFPPVVVWSGSADVRAVVQAFRHGASDFLLKPCSEAELAKSIARAAGKDALRRGLNYEPWALERFAVA
jgi:FixJ family two-component response regulator